MNGTVREFKVTILGSDYTLVSDESDTAMLATVRLVDSAMGEIAKRTPLLDAAKVAVLTSLRFAGQVVQAERQHAEHEEWFKKMIAQIDSAIGSVSSF